MCRASDFALSCVEYILEDQITNPINVTRNFFRLKNVMNDLTTTLSRDFGASGDAGQSILKSTPKNSLMLLEKKIRHKIWLMLSSKDIMNLRLTSKSLRYEIDNEFGLSVRMDTDSESMAWLQTVCTRKCFVSNLKNLLYFNFLPQPDKMESLRLHHEIHLTVEQLELIMRKFPNLVNLIFYTKQQDTAFLDSSMNCKELKQIFPSRTNSIFRVLNQRPIFGYSIVNVDDQNVIEWRVEFRKNTYSLKFLRCSIPITMPNVQKDVVQLLRHQNELYEIDSELEGVTSMLYMEVVEKNFKSLVRISLLLVSCRKPFDFEPISKCSQLRFLSLGGENKSDTIHAYLPLVGIVKLVPLRKLMIISFQHVHLSEIESEAFFKISRNVWTTIRHSMVVNQLVVEDNYGWHKRHVGTNDTCSNYDRADYSDDEDELLCKHDEDVYPRVKKCTLEILLDEVLDSSPACRTLQALLVTLWLILC